MIFFSIEFHLVIFFNLFVIFSLLRRLFATQCRKFPTGKVGRIRREILNRIKMHSSSNDTDTPSRPLSPQKKKQIRKKQNTQKKNKEKKRKTERKDTKWHGSGNLNCGKSYCNLCPPARQDQSRGGEFRGRGWIGGHADAGVGQN